MNGNITFEKLDDKYYDILIKWWHSNRVKEFWDNSEEMEEDVRNYALKGKKTLYDYYIGLYDNVAYALVITSEQTAADYYKYYKDLLSKNGKTYAIDFMIGNDDYIGKHLSSKTLKTFIENYSDSKADTFIIDPVIDNEIAFKCYVGAGFEVVGEYTPNEGYFSGKKHYLMTKKVERK